MEALLAQHRKEVRDLQSRVTQKKKQASKKTRKGVNEECERLEVELKAKHQAEIAFLEGGDAADMDGDGDTVANQLDDLTLRNDEGNGNHAASTRLPDDEAGLAENVGLPSTTSTAAADTTPLSPAKSEAAIPKKGNRQKARLARRAAEQDELAKQAEAEAQDLPDMKQQERTRMLESMSKHGLREEEIRADGHCLYSAVADQLEQLGIPLANGAPGDHPVIAYKAVRTQAAAYIEQHQDDFVPFLEEPLPEYVHKVRDTAEWGGQLELMALAKSFDVDINVLQDFGRVERIESDANTGGGEKGGRAMWLGYYKHGFGLGEHYNSLRKAT